MSRKRRRGTAAETRVHLVAAGATVFNRDGYYNTDSNRIAREAGYSPGTFYKHFEDKSELFCAVYKERVTAEWRELRDAAPTPAKLLEIVLQHHTRWAGLRRSLPALVATDPAVRRLYRTARREQLAALGGPREEAALLLFTVERTADALAGDEAKALGLDPARLKAALIRALAPARALRRR